MFPMLTTLIALPLIGAIALLFFQKEQLAAIRWTAVLVAALDFILAIGLAISYAGSHVSAGSLAFNGAPNGTFLFAEQLNWIPGIGISYSLGIDGISLLLVFLTTLLTLICIGASFGIDNKAKNYMAFMLVLESGMLGVFLATNLFLFYIFWELMLIPAYFLVGAWGGPRRIYAALKFVIFTSVGSFLMLAGIIALGYYHQQAGGGFSLDLATLLNTRLDGNTQTWIFLAFAAAFAVKVPLVPFHSWLPNAYSEAPAPVTALLAGAMSKTGAYGFLRFCIQLFPQAAHQFAPLMSTLAVVGIIYCAFLALIQTDLKRLLGYSSISHLGVVMLGMFAMNTQGVEGSVLQMVNHGITTAALFLIVGLIEMRLGTRRLSAMGGLAFRLPMLATIMFIAALSSLGLPGLNSFSGEFLALLGAFQHNALFGALGTLVVIPAAWYMIRFFQGVMEGARTNDSEIITRDKQGLLRDIRLGELVPLIPLLGLIFYLGVQPAPLTFLMEPSVVTTLQHLGSAFVR